jgi:hypothetical protein
LISAAEMPSALAMSSTESPATALCMCVQPIGLQAVCVLQGGRDERGSQKSGGAAGGVTRRRNGCVPEGEGRVQA